MGSTWNDLLAQTAGHDTMLDYLTGPHDMVRPHAVAYAKAHDPELFRYYVHEGWVDAEGRGPDEGWSGPEPGSRPYRERGDE